MVAVSGHRFADGFKEKLLRTRKYWLVQNGGRGFLHLPIDWDVTLDTRRVHVHPGIQFDVENQCHSLAGCNGIVALASLRRELFALYFGRKIRRRPSELVYKDRRWAVSGRVVEILRHDNAASIQDVPSGVNLGRNRPNSQAEFVHCFAIFFNLVRLARGSVDENQRTFGSQKTFDAALGELASDGRPGVARARIAPRRSEQNKDCKKQRFHSFYLIIAPLSTSAVLERRKSTIGTVWPGMTWPA